MRPFIKPIVFPSSSQFVSLTCDTGDAGLKEHLTEEYVLNLSARLAVHSKLVPVLVEMWLSHLEYLVHGMEEICSKDN